MTIPPSSENQLFQPGYRQSDLDEQPFHSFDGEEQDYRVTPSGPLPRDLRSKLQEPEAETVARYSGVLHNVHREGDLLVCHASLTKYLRNPAYDSASVFIRAFMDEYPLKWQVTTFPANHSSGKNYVVIADANALAGYGQNIQGMRGYKHALRELAREKNISLETWILDETFHESEDLIKHHLRTAAQRKK